MPPDSPDIAIAHEYRRVAQSTPGGVVEHAAAVIREKDGDQDFVAMLRTDADPMIAAGDTLTWGKFTLIALFPSYPHFIATEDGEQIEGWVVECKEMVS